MSNQLQSQVQKASRLIKKGYRNEAFLIYEELKKNPIQDLICHIQLGNLCSELDKHKFAIEHYKFAVQKEPANAQYLCFLSTAYREDKQLDAALHNYQKALELDENIHAIHSGLGIIYLEQSNYLLAVKYLEQARQLKPSDVGILSNLSIALIKTDQHEIALQHAQKALKLDSKNPLLHNTVGKILSDMGRTQEAINSFEKAINKNNKFGAAYDNLARAKKFTAADMPFIIKTEKLLHGAMPAEQRYNLLFSLGKMYDDCNEWDKAFEHYSQANLLAKKNYDLKFEKNLFKKIKKIFNASYVKEFNSIGEQSDVPVFIVGMPRSGTTLMEQIVEGHSQASSIGESNEMSRIATSIFLNKDQKTFSSEILKNMQKDKLKQFAQDYLSVLQKNSINSIRIVDKLPENYFNLGLISILFPNATIIHVTRNPLDTCLSCYFQNFTQIKWAYDLNIIAEKYIFYRYVMNYWKSVLPEGKIVEINYENMINDPHEIGRQLYNACGLEWKAESLNFYTNKNIVTTASASQIRQPMYNSSIHRWKNYTPHIDELVKKLSNYLLDEQQVLQEHGINTQHFSGISRFKRFFH